jgi:hypothetical protein
METNGPLARVTVSASSPVRLFWYERADSRAIRVTAARHTAYPADLPVMGSPFGIPVMDAL